jgi:DNA adenine methylase
MTTITMLLPRKIAQIKVPPIKCQGIKTKLVPFISESVTWDGLGRWIEPFLGSGVVLFNIAPTRALVADSNPHIISFYQGIQEKRITAPEVRLFLQKEGSNLEHYGKEYYYEVRDRFNSHNDPLDLLFLSRACFNGVMRFNKKGYFNVPFNHKIDRFSKAYITKIVNQVKWVSEIINGKDWQFVCSDWRDTFKQCEKSDFVYLDPPYYGRHTGYMGIWSEQEMFDFVNKVKLLPCGYALSLWRKNIYRTNTLIDDYFSNHVVRVFSHDYFVGPTESLRHEIEEALIIKQGFDADLNICTYNN